MLKRDDATAIHRARAEFLEGYPERIMKNQKPVHDRLTELSGKMDILPGIADIRAILERIEAAVGQALAAMVEAAKTDRAAAAAETKATRALIEKHRTAVRLSLMDVAGEHAFGQECLVLLGAVGCVGPYVRGRVVRADEDRQPCAIMSIGGASVSGADQAMSAIDTYVVLVPEHRDGEVDWLERLGVGAVLHLGFGVLNAPARIAVFLAELGRLVLPELGDPPFQTSGLLLLGIALLGRRHNGGVDDLAAHCE